MPPIAYRESHAGIIVFDIHDPASIQGLDYRIQQFTDYARPDVVLVLVGNKIDLYTNESNVSEYLLNDTIDKLMR